ncbi:MAG: 2-oxo-4-hydroxy-4-carboxy-5-ureidoimidazoline decarboxylase [Alteromonadaceae bacterium]|nr:2-oxo-4-hydroxy-4-carboxy-5-ureidoimidazoline decarboxylase [Alteromonadaceae bacterium]
MTLDQLNELNDQTAYDWFQLACVAPKWVSQMVAARPFSSLDDMQQQSAEIWRSLDKEQFLAAFEGHPMIGDVSTLKAKFANTAGAAGHEQSGAAIADENTLQMLLQKNKEYLNKHGFIFIIFATGKSAKEMLSALLSRIDNNTDVEIANAAAEQNKITQLRLAKNLEQE